MLGELTQYVSKYKLWDLNVIPIKPNDKKPAVPWASFQKRKASEEELINWFGDNSHNIAVVCGGISGNLVVLDFDNRDLYLAFSAYWQEFYHKPIQEMTPIVQTGGGGYHVYLKVKQKPQLYHPTGDERKHIPDIQSEGGYVLAPPSIHPNGNSYKFLNEVKIIHEVKSLSELAIDIPKKSSTPKSGEEPIGETSRNTTLTKMGGAMRRQGMPQQAIEVALLEVNASQCQPPLTQDEVIGIAKSMSRYAPLPSPPPREGYVYSEERPSEAKRYKNVTGSVTKTLQSVTKEEKTLQAQEVLSQKVLEWVKGTSGWWGTDELDKELGITNRNNRRIILHRLKEQGIIEHHSKINKQFRYINVAITSLDFKAAAYGGILPVRWPMGIEKFTNIYPGNLIVVAGSPNAGKTAFLLNFIRKNQDEFAIKYFCSEMGSEELRDRLDKFPDMGIEDWKFEAIERAEDFADVIVPDCVNIVDYLEMTTELFSVNTHLTAIEHRVGSGLAIVALQKKMGAPMGRGQEFGMEKPKLYLSMDKGKLQIIKGKSWVKKDVDPNGLRISFNIIDGCQFETTGNWTR